MQCIARVGINRRSLNTSFKFTASHEIIIPSDTASRPLNVAIFVALQAARSASSECISALRNVSSFSSSSFSSCYYYRTMSCIRSSMFVFLSCRCRTLAPMFGNVSFFSFLAILFSILQPVVFHSVHVVSRCSFLHSGSLATSSQMLRILFRGMLPRNDHLLKLYKDLLLLLLHSAECCTLKSSIFTSVFFFFIFLRDHVLYFIQGACDSPEMLMSNFSINVLELAQLV